MYIAEMLTGRTVEKPHFYWHGNSWSSVKSAKDYLSLPGILDCWVSTPQATDFVDWLFNCATVMRERLEWAEIREGLTYEQSFDKRGVFTKRESKLLANIPKMPMLIQKVITHRGEQRWPWEHSRTELLPERN
jgi:hypothetical protein